jgi:hypothetical protein
MSGTTNTLLWVGVAAVAAFALYEVMKGQAPTTTVIKTSTPSTASTTAAEVTAGASALTAIASDLFSSDDDS